MDLITKWKRSGVLYRYPCRSPDFPSLSSRNTIIKMLSGKEASIIFLINQLIVHQVMVVKSFWNFLKIRS